MAHANTKSTAADNDLAEQLRLMRAENAALKAQIPAPKVPSCKVANKGGISVSNIGQRFPTTLYTEGWIAIFGTDDPDAMPEGSIAREVLTIARDNPEVKTKSEDLAEYYKRTGKSAPPPR